MWNSCRFRQRVCSLESRCTAGAAAGFRLDQARSFLVSVRLSASRPVDPRPCYGASPSPIVMPALLRRTMRSSGSVQKAQGVAICMAGLYRKDGVGGNFGTRHRHLGEFVRLPDKFSGAPTDPRESKNLDEGGRNGRHPHRPSSNASANSRATSEIAVGGSALAKEEQKDVSAETFCG